MVIGKHIEIQQIGQSCSRWRDRFRWRDVFGQGFRCRADRLLPLLIIQPGLYPLCALVAVCVEIGGHAFDDVGAVTVTLRTLPDAAGTIGLALRRLVSPHRRQDAHLAAIAARLGQGPPTVPGLYICGVYFSISCRIDIVLVAWHLYALAATGQPCDEPAKVTQIWPLSIAVGRTLSHKCGLASK